MKTLYLGLRAPPGVYHYPVIDIEQIEIDPEIFSLWPKITHMIITSRTTVELWPGPWDKKVIAIGEKTAEELRKKGVDPIVAPFATQEGIISILSDIKGFFLYPKSQKARLNLCCFLKKENIPFHSFDLYRPVFQKPLPVPDLEQFDEIIFTSPSTVEGFIHIFGALPKGKQLTAIGPITKEALFSD